MQKYINIIFRIILVIVGSLMLSDALAQNNLNRGISINVQQRKLADVLNTIGQKGNFYFAYNSRIINGDSLISINADNKTIKELLDEVFHSNIDYKEAPGYIILRPAPYRLTMRPDTSLEAEDLYYISGYVVDDSTGRGIQNASVYEKRLLVSTLTNERGFFRLKIKSDGVITLTVSKDMYKDTSINFLNKVTVNIHKRNYSYSADAASSRAERSWLGRMFISSRQRVQNLNLGGFVSSVPVQTSLVPGLSNHGMMSGQIVNDFSLNLIGGYTAGTNGVEMAGMFNINKQDAKYVQAAGLFNVVGRNMSGVQMAGISNTILKNANGVQAAGLYNMVKDTMRGVQMAGLFNKNGTSHGVQAAGLFNLTKGNSVGLQMAGLTNITRGRASGMQVAGLFNRAKVMKGVHLATINIADTLDGYAIGVLNLSRNGYHKLLVFNNETTTANIGFKSGNAKLYTLISGGVNLTNDVRYYGVGFTLGHDFVFSNTISLSAEIGNQMLLSDKWKNNSHSVNRINALLNVKAGPKVSFFAGPSFNIYHNDNSVNALAEMQQIIKNKPGLQNWNNNNKAWIGWTAGISFF
jgi:hypothetical protein